MKNWRSATWLVLRVKTNYILGIPDPDLPVYYTTFMGLWWRWRVVYSWLSYCEAVLGHKFTSRRNGSHKWRFRGKRSLNIDFFLTPKRHILGRQHVFWRRPTVSQHPYWRLGCRRHETKQTSDRSRSASHNSLIFPLEYAYVQNVCYVRLFRIHVRKNRRKCRRSGGRSAANNSAPSCIIAKNSQWYVICNGGARIFFLGG